LKLRNRQLQTDYLAPEEFVVLLKGLSDVDKKRILLISEAKHVSGTGLECEDLFHEAVVRILDGSRHIPRDVPIMASIIETIRSIASSERGIRKREDVIDPLEDDFYQGVSDARPSPEAISDVSDQIKKAIDIFEQKFETDPHAYALLKGRMEGLSHDEILELVPMSDKQFNSARKRMMRAIIRINAERAYL